MLLGELFLIFSPKNRKDNHMLYSYYFWYLSYNLLVYASLVVRSINLCLISFENLDEIRSFLKFQQGFYCSFIGLELYGKLSPFDA